jgi:hypothetical protein
MATRKKSPVGAVVVLMLSDGEIEMGSNDSSVNHADCYLPGPIILFQPVIDLFGLRSGL